MKAILYREDRNNARGKKFKIPGFDSNPGLLIAGQMLYRWATRHSDSTSPKALPHQTQYLSKLGTSKEFLYHIFLPAHNLKAHPQVTYKEEGANASSAGDNNHHSAFAIFIFCLSKQFWRQK